MGILAVVLLVVWAVLAVIGFAFQGLLWLAIIAIILFIGTVVVALLRIQTVKRRSALATAKPAAGGSMAGKSAAPSTPRTTTTGRPASPSAAPNAAPTARDQRTDGVVSDDKINPAGNLE